LNGLNNGIIRSLEAPFWGHGLGTSGYLVFQESVNSKIKIPFIIDNDFVSNGSESAVGVLLFQTGYIFTFLYLLLFLHLAYKFHRLKNYVYVGLCFGYLLAYFLTESVFTMSVFTVFVFYVKNAINES